MLIGGNILDHYLHAGREQGYTPPSWEPDKAKQYAANFVVVKSTIHYRAAFEPIASEIIEVDAPGLSSSNLGRFDFKRIRRPIFPLDPDTTYR